MLSSDDREDDRSNPKVEAAIERGFHAGTLGHVLSSPLPKEREPLLWAWLDLHGGRTLVNEEGRVVGVWACFCATCEILASDFVCRAGIDLVAQGAGDSTVRRVNDEEAQLQERATSIKDSRLEERLAQLCADLAVRIAEQVSEQVAEKVARRVAGEVARKAQCY